MAGIDGMWGRKDDSHTHQLLRAQFLPTTAAEGDSSWVLFKRTQLVAVVPQLGTCGVGELPEVPQ